MRDKSFFLNPQFCFLCLCGLDLFISLLHVGSCLLLRLLTINIIIINEPYRDQLADNACHEPYTD